MLSDKFYITVASLPDREHLVAEIFYMNQQWIEISEEHDDLMIQFYPHPRQSYWEFTLDEALEALQEAKRRYLALGPNLSSS